LRLGPQSDNSPPPARRAERPGFGADCGDGVPGVKWPWKAKLMRKATTLREYGISSGTRWLVSARNGSKPDSPNPLRNRVRLGEPIHFPASPSSPTVYVNEFPGPVRRARFSRLSATTCAAPGAAANSPFRSRSARGASGTMGFRPVPPRFACGISGFLRLQGSLFNARLRSAWPRGTLASSAWKRLQAWTLMHPG